MTKVESRGCVHVPQQNIYLKTEETCIGEVYDEVQGYPARGEQLDQSRKGKGEGEKCWCVKYNTNILQPVTPRLTLL